MDVIDFLYADHERVASFLSQLGGSDGLLKEVTSEETRAKNDSAKANLGARFLGLNAGVEVGESSSAQHDTRMVYDPLWTNSLKLIQEVESKSKAKKSADPLPKIGQLRQISGRLRVFDIGYLPSLVKSPAMVGFIMKGQSKDDDATFSDDANGRNEAEVTQSYLGALPFGIQFLLDDGKNQYWFNLKRQYLSLYDLDIPLKFPQKIPGAWKAIGIVDAAPDDDSMDDIDELPNAVRQHIPPFMQKLAQLPENTNEMFGRQSCTYGLRA
jgi:hypothetical protein